MIFNVSNKLFKKGMALMPICFGISFTKTLMNQARALVHVYTDGSVWHKYRCRGNGAGSEYQNAAGGRQTFFQLIPPK